MRHYRLLTKISPVLSTTCSYTWGTRGHEGHKYCRPITLSEQPYIANAQCEFSFKKVSNCVTFLKIRMHISDRIRYFCNRKIRAIQTKLNSSSRHETRSFCEGSVMHGPREEVGGGGNRWPGLTLKITSSIGNKQLSSTPPPPLENVGPPLKLKITFLVRLWNTMKACQICLAQVYILDSGSFLKQNDHYMWLIVFSYQINLKACNDI